MWIIKAEGGVIMGRFSFKSGTFSEDSRPIFTSNGMHVLFATGSATQVSLLEPEVLKEKLKP